MVRRYSEAGARDIGVIGGGLGDGLLSGDAASFVVLEVCAAGLGGGSTGGGSCAMAKVGQIKKRKVVFNTARMGICKGWAGARCFGFKTTIVHPQNPFRTTCFPATIR